MHFDWLGYPTTDVSGVALVRANLSARQAKVRGLLTSGTYGPTSTSSSSSAALQSSLASKLRVLMASTGSTLYTLTWKERATPSGLRICALRASAPRTSANGSTGWPTPCAQEYAGNPEASIARKQALGIGNTCTILAQQVTMVGPARLTATGEMLTGSLAGMESSGQLNPAHSRWLMGYPPEWDACGAMAMPSSRKSPQRSSKLL